MTESQQLPDGGAPQPPEIGDGESGNPGGAGMEFLALEDSSGGAARNPSEAHREYDGGAQQLLEIGEAESGNPGGAGKNLGEHGGAESWFYPGEHGGAETRRNLGEHGHREYGVCLFDHNSKLTMTENGGAQQLSEIGGGAGSARNSSEAPREYGVHLFESALQKAVRELKELPEQNLDGFEEFSEQNLVEGCLSGGQSCHDWGQGLSDLLAGQVNEEPTTIEDLPEDILSYIVSLVYPLDRKEWMKCKLLRKSAVGQACYDNRFGKSGEKNIVKDLILLIDDEENLLDALKRRKVSRRRRKEVNSLAYTLEVLRRPFKGQMRYWTKKSMADLLNEPGAVKLC